MASIKDVAKLAKVAKSTVSLVVNDSGYVSKETREKVEKAMKELNYVPNQLAKNLSLSQSHIIGIVVPDLVHPFFASFVKYVEQKLYEKGYMTMVCGTLGREQVEVEYLSWLNNYTMDGIIMCAHTLDVAAYQKTARPIVSLDRYLNEDIPVIASNHEQAAKLTVDKLRENKCKKVVQFVGSSNANVGSDNYALTCQKLFCEPSEELVLYRMPVNTFTLEEYLAVAEKAMEKHGDADAFVGSDMVITQCLKMALAYGYEVPSEKKFIAYDGTQITRISYPVISAVEQPIEQLALSTVQAIIARIEGQDRFPKEIKHDVIWQQGATTI